MDCSICLDALDSGVVALPCGHRFHAACLAQCAAAVGTAATTSRRGTLTACPNCRTTSRVVPATSATHRVGEKVLALWGHRWFPGVVDDVIDGGGAYEIAWDDEDSSNEVPASRVRAAPVTVDVDAPAPRHARAAAVVPPRAAPPVLSPPAPAPRSSGPPPAPRAIVPRDAPARPPPAPPLPPVTRSHVASTSSVWFAVCTELLAEVAKDRTNMRGLREPLTSRGFICGADQKYGARFPAEVPPDFPCYYDVVGKDYAIHDHAQSLATMRKYLEGALAHARAGGAYRTEAEYKPRPAPVRARTSRFTGVRRNSSRWRAMIYVRGSNIPLGDFDEEEDAARAYDAAVVKYRGGPTVNFPGEAPLASVLAALPDAPPPPPPPAPLSRLRPQKKATYKPTVVRAKPGISKEERQHRASRAAYAREYRQEQKKKKEQKKQANAAKLKAWVGKNDGVELYLQDEGYYQGYVATAWKSTSRRRVAGVEVDARLTTKPCKS